MERIILKPYQLRQNSYKKNDKKISAFVELFIQKFGQLQDIIVRKIGSNYEILSGNKIFRALKERTDKISCLNLGEISDYDATIIRICMNELNFKTDTIKFAEEIGKIVKTKHDAKLLSSKIDLDIIDIMRYLRLDDVDWKKELKIVEEEKKMNQTLF